MVITARGLAGATVRRERDGTLAVAGLDADAIAELAARRHVVLHPPLPASVRAAAGRARWVTPAGVRRGA
jgi:hypothetical protein